MQTNYDYIITGTGAAGYSLLLQMCSNAFFKNKRILAIEKSEKQTNDRTWCFWQSEASYLETIVYKKWSSLRVAGSDYEKQIDISPYQYKMIRAIDFYNHAKNELAKFENITWLNAEVAQIEDTDTGVLVVANDITYYAQFVFNSIINKELRKETHHSYLLQHFRGWIVETTDAVFNPDVATFMDFNVDQKFGTAFVYVMPFTKNKALIEYTLFTKNKLTDDQYDYGLANYIAQNFKITNYKIAEIENGVIPMTDMDFSSHKKNVIDIGTAGGATRGSSGYTFTFIQKQTKAIIAALVNKEHPKQQSVVLGSKSKFYDRVMLRVLYKNLVPGNEVFGRMFKRTSLVNILSFLNDDSSLRNDLKIILSQPKWPFIKALFK